jgi:hypothetical protein
MPKREKTVKLLVLGAVDVTLNVPFSPLYRNTELLAVERLAATNPVSLLVSPINEDNALSL